MKLTKLSSAVSVSLLAVALTACGGSNEANDPPVKVTTPEVNPQPKPQPKPDTSVTTPDIKDTAVQIQATIDDLKKQGLTDENAKNFVAKFPNVKVGTEAYNDLVKSELAKQNAVDTTPAQPTSTVVVQANPLIKNVDASKEATVTTNQYVRQPGSQFDRRANPHQQGGLGEVGIDDPTVQNPYLSNYVLAAERVGKTVVATDSAGEYVVNAGNANDDQGKTITQGRSPYVKNGALTYTVETEGKNRTYVYGDPTGTKTKNFDVDLSKANFSANEDAQTVTALARVTNAKGDAESNAVGYVDKIATLQEINKATTIVDADNGEKAIKLALTPNATPTDRNNGVVQAASYQGLESGLLVYNGASVNVGNKDGVKLGLRVPVMGAEENIYDEKGVALNAVEAYQAPSAEGNFDANKDLNGQYFLARELVSYTNKDNTGKVFAGEFYKDPAQALQKTATSVTNKASILSLDTGITGKTSDAWKRERHVANLVANNFETRIFGKNYNSYESGAKGVQTTENTYVARYTGEDRLRNIGTAVLQHVQYGRLTNNIDVLANKTEKSPEQVIYRQYQHHGADNSVDTYFYRGTNHTTLDQMKDLKARGGMIEYNGHALTYGIGPKAQQTVAKKGLPTAYGLSSGEATIGNFVHAKFDVAKQKVDGSVYNFLNKSVTADSTVKDFVKQDLVTFEGDVFGNTVAGKAAKVGTEEVGSFTGSFFGENANELGGSISSIERSKGYAQPKWGAVFGATKGSNVENFNIIERDNKDTVKK